MIVPHTSLNSHTDERERCGIKTRTNIFCIQLLLTKLKLEKLLLPFVVLKTCFTKKYLYFVSINYFRPLHCYKDWVFNFPFTKLRYNVVSISLLTAFISLLIICDLFRAFYSMASLHMFFLENGIQNYAFLY